jgi:thioesterase domain-containing protein
MIEAGETVKAGTTNYPLSFAQERLAAASLQRPEDAAHNASMRWRIRGDLSQAVLENAWRFLIVRHEILRMRFPATSVRAEQVVEASVPFRVAIVHCSALDPSIIDQEIDRIAASDAGARFDISVAPLLRVTRLILGATDSLLLVTAHQIVCDGWSFGLLARELGTVCAALSAGRVPQLPELTTTFGAFAGWQRGAMSDDALAEEYGLLAADFVEPLSIEITTDFARPSHWTSHVDTRSRVLDTQRMQDYVDEARGSGSTPFMATLAAMALALRGRVSAGILAITTQVVGRDDVDLESVVGPFVNTMPLRLDIDGSHSLPAVLERIGDAVANALELRHVPFELAARRLFPIQGEDRGAVCGVNFLYQRAFTRDIDYGDFRISSEHSHPGGSQYDVSVYVVERPGGWRLTCDFNPDLYRGATIDAILDRFEETIAGGIDRRPPVLFFHSDLFADGFYANEIAANIADRRIVPIGPHGIGDRPLLLSIDAMAEDYLKNLDAIQAKGPYRLVGFCAGALVAFEVARLLKARGEEVAAVILINATAPARPILPFRDFVIRAVARNARLSPRVREIVCYNVARFNRALLRGPRETFEFLRNLGASYSRPRTATSSQGSGETFVRSRGDAVSELSFAHIGAALSHRPHYFDGPVTLIWSSDQSNLTGEPTQGWNRLSTSVRTVGMSGGHVAPLHELVGDLSILLQDILTVEPTACG